MKRSLFKLSLIAVLIVVFCSNTSFAFDSSMKKIFVKTGYTYLFVFPDKIKHYEIGKEKALKVELLTNIFNDKHEMLIRPTAKEDTNIIVWTQKGVYNLDVFIDKDGEEISKILEFKRDSAVEIDQPPVIKDKILNHTLDVPPILKKKGKGSL